MDIKHAPEVAYCRANQDLPQNVDTFCLHHYWQLHMYLAPCELRTGEESFNVESGNLSLTPPGIKTHYRTRSALPYYVAHVDVGTLRHSRAVVWREPEHEAEIRDVFAKACRLTHAYPQRADLYVWDLLLLLNPPLGPSLLSSKVSQAVEWMTQHVHRQASVSEISQVVKLSGVHLNRLFVSETGKTATAYFRDLKLKQVQYMLTQTDIPIKSIAADVGFVDLHAFNKWVKTYLGYPPSGIRSLH